MAAPTKPDLLALYRVQRSIFGVCPHSGSLFRLSDCKIFQRTAPRRDWMDDVEDETERLNRVEDKLDEREDELREVARKKGRALAMKMVRLVDPVFTPRKLNPDDAKVLFHPVDYVVFRGMKNDAANRILLLDKATASKERLALQRSIEKAVEKEFVEWLTIRVNEDGSVEREE